MPDTDQEDEVETSTEIARMPRELVQMARLVGAVRQESIGEVLNRHAHASLKAEYTRIIKAAGDALKD